MPFYTGPELKLLRKQRGLTGIAVAKAMGSSANRISEIEARAVVPQKAAARYLAALDKAQTEAA